MSATAELKVSYAQFLEQLNKFRNIIQLGQGRILGQWTTGQWRAYQITDIVTTPQEVAQFSPSSGAAGVWSENGLQPANVVAPVVHIDGADAVNVAALVPLVVQNVPPGNLTFNSTGLHITTSTTNTYSPGGTPFHLAAVVIAVEVGGAGWTLTIKDKAAPAKILVNALSVAAALTLPDVLSFSNPIPMVGGVDVVTAGAAPGTLDVWLTGWA